MEERVVGGVRVIRISRWDEFASRVGSGGDYISWGFRGQPDERFPLRSSLSRLLHDYGIDRRAWPLQEARIIRIFKRKAHLFLDHVPPDTDNFQWLAVMQHHGAPTRLLDFTWSPYVAAFFALERATRDCAVWAVHPRITWELQSEVAEKLSAHDLNLRRPGVFERYYLSGEHQFVWQGEPAIMNRRLIMQEGTFFVSGALDAALESVFAGHRDSAKYVHKFVFDVNAVRGGAMLALYAMNLTHASLFPDLDGLARSMAYEAEFHWALDVRTLQPYPGYELEPHLSDRKVSTVDPPLDS